MSERMRSLNAKCFLANSKSTLYPQGSLAERCRAGGAGVSAFFTPAGYGTEVAEGKEVRPDGKPHILESALISDFAFVKALEAKDYPKKPSFRCCNGSNFNPMMSVLHGLAAAEVEELVPLGELDPNTPYTHNEARKGEVREQNRTKRWYVTFTKTWIAKRIAQEVRNGWYVNLRIGIPTLVANQYPGKHRRRVPV